MSERAWLDSELSRICPVHSKPPPRLTLGQITNTAATNLSAVVNQFSDVKNYANRPGYPFEGAALTDAEVRQLEGKP